MLDQDERARRVLFAVVTEFIARGEPVGSSTIARKYRLSVSPATIRAELAQLADTGLLYQPHTSAGRVPTDAGFRLFVDALLSAGDFDGLARDELTRRYESLRQTAPPTVDTIIQKTGEFLSEMTGAAAVVVRPSIDAAPLRDLRFVPVGEKRLLAVIVSEAGVVENRIVSVDRAPDDRELEHVHNVLKPLVRGQTLRALRDRLAAEMRDDRTRLDAERRAALELGVTALGAITPDAHMVLAGQENLLKKSRFAELGTIRSVLFALDEREKLLSLLDRTIAAHGVQVVIGSESQIDEMRDVSVVSASYGPVTGEPHGVVGVIGPTRMDYGRVVPLVDEAARRVSVLLEEPE